jgi:hypothetical protein
VHEREKMELRMRLRVRWLGAWTVTRATACAEAGRDEELDEGYEREKT